MDLIFRLKKLGDAENDDLSVAYDAIIEIVSLRLYLQNSRDERDSLLEALKMIAGEAPCVDNLMGDKDIARAAIAAVEGEKT